jgi:pimeloyl-ACP methyl ester carboxylesterase
VVLIHGLWVTRQVLLVWRRQFERRGVAAVAFGYPSREPLADNMRRLATFAESQARPLYLLGHSLGGLLILGLLARAGDAAPLPIRRAVLAGTPVAGSESARRFVRWRFGRWLVAGAAPLLQPARLAAGPAGAMPFEVGVISGARAIGLGKLLGALPTPNDGTIPVAETRYAGARDSIVLPLSHSQMLLSGRVVTQSLAFFAGGRFDHDDEL